MNNKFEILAKLYGLDTNKNEHNYLNLLTEMCHEFYELGRQERYICPAILDNSVKEVGA